MSYRIDRGHCRHSNEVVLRNYKLNMPWRASSVMEEKLSFVFEYERDEHSMTDLCCDYCTGKQSRSLANSRGPE